MNSTEKIKRRQFLKNFALTGTVLSGIPLLYWSPLFQEQLDHQRYLGEMEFTVVEGLVEAWCDSWPQLPGDVPRKRMAYFKNLDEVLNVIREDLRQELRMALKLLSYPPACFFLTSYFNPWSDVSKCQKILNKWQFSQNAIHKKLYFSFTSLFAAPFYSDSRSWQFIGYPGPPEISREES
jgi:hypothetical protein